jgi:hypothetical protein
MTASKQESSLIMFVARLTLLQQGLAQLVTLQVVATPL